MEALRLIPRKMSSNRTFSSLQSSYINLTRQCITWTIICNETARQGSSDLRKTNHTRLGL